MNAVVIQHNLPIAVVATHSSAPLHTKVGYRTLRKYLLRDDRPGNEATLQIFLQEWVPPNCALEVKQD